MARWAATRPPVVWLAVSGLAYALLFYLAFGNRYSLMTIGPKAGATIASLNKLAPEGFWLYVGSFAAAFSLYGCGYGFGVRRADGRGMWAVVIGGGALLCAVMLPMYATDAADIYDYIIRGRLSAIYGLNPLQATPRAVPDDPFFELAGWKNVPSAYGPAWEALAAVAARLAGDDHLTNVLVFKGIAVVGHALTAMLVALTLRVLAPRRALIGVFLFTWNPLIVYMTAGRGHNDIWLAATTVLGLYCMVKRWYVGGIGAATLGALIKFIPALYVPLFALIALRDLPNVRARIRFVILSAMVSGALAVVLYGPYWFGLETLRAGRRTAMYTGSAPTVLRQLLAPILDGKNGDSWTTETPITNALLANATLILFGACYVGVLWAAYQQRDPYSVIQAVVVMLFAYLLVASLWLMSWYVVWVLPAAALLPDGALRRYALIFSYAVTWQTPIYQYVTLRYTGFAPIPWRDLIPISFYLLPGYGLIAWFWLRAWARRGGNHA